jgi:hypothetical protein
VLLSDIDAAVTALLGTLLQPLLLALPASMPLV